MGRYLVRGIGTVLLVGWILGPGATRSQTRADPAPPARPNIVVIMVDDLDVGSLTTLETLGYMPNLTTHLILQGTRFTNSFVTNSLCCPSRATFLTGQYAHNTGVRSNNPPDGISNFDDRSTVATWLHDAGYRTGYVGKYLNGYGQVDVTGDGMVTGADRAYVPPGWTDWQGLLDYSTYTFYNYQVNSNGQIQLHGAGEADYQTDVLARRAVRFIEESDRPEHEGVPFFLVVTPLAPHVEVFWWSIFQSPWQWDLRPAARHAGTLPLGLPRPFSFNELDVWDKPSWVRDFRPRMTASDIAGITRQYQHRLESMRAVDDLIGQVVAAVEAAGELEHTVIVFTSDNGYLHGEHRMQQKVVAYEESIRVPLFVRLPGGAASIVPQLVINNDLAPTIAELAGVLPGLPVDGLSWLPLIRQPQQEWRRRFLVEHWAATTDLRWDVPTYAAVRAHAAMGVSRDLVYVQYEDGAYTPEFYDLAVDPYQLWSQHGSIDPGRVQLQAWLRAWIAAAKTCQTQTCRVLEFMP